MFIIARGTGNIYLILTWVSHYHTRFTTAESHPDRMFPCILIDHKNHTNNHVALVCQRYDLYDSIEGAIWSGDTRAYYTGKEYQLNYKMDHIFTTISC